MMIRSVNGMISRSAVCGKILPHEHFFIDLRLQAAAGASERVTEPDGWLELHDNPYLSRANLQIDDMNVALNAARALLDFGCDTVVDCTLPEIGRNLERLRELSRRSGVRIIAGTGYYTAGAHPPIVNEAPWELLRDGMLAELNDFAGIIGEIGTSSEIFPAEAKVLHAAAAAQRESGAPMQIHTFPWSRATGYEAATLLLREGVCPGKIVICHTDMLPDIQYMKSILELGVYLQFDDFGKEFPMRKAGGFGAGRFGTDDERCDALCRLIDAGFLNQLLITNDICLKCMLPPWGGKGYVHVFDAVAEKLRRRGVTSEQWQRLTGENPAEWLGI